MGFINQKERVFDVVLTHEGRELLAKNQLNFSFYAFSDDGIDYSGSFASSSFSTGTLDNYVHRNIAFESRQMKNKDLNYFLYTIPAGKKILPNMNINLSGNVTLERRYQTQTIRERMVIDPKEKESTIAIIMRASVIKESEDERINNYVKEQQVGKSINAIVRGLINVKDLI